MRMARPTYTHAPYEHTWRTYMRTYMHTYVAADLDDQFADGEAYLHTCTHTSHTCTDLDDQFANGEAYLRRMIERDRAKRGAAANGSGSLFRRPLPCGLSMLGIATQVNTAGFQILREEFDVALGGGCVEEEEEEEAEAQGAAVELPEAATTGAATPEAETETGDLTNPEEAAEWPDDGWVPPCTEYMYCSLCKGRSGVAGRWGVPGEGLEPSALRCPLMVCQPCQRWHGLLQAEDGQGEQADASWVQDTLLVEAREGIWGQRVAQLVHPILGEIGH